ncbi:Bet v I/Major latex protein [Dillenia turbinata]|uniref:Protein FAR1-RELATED SEQUENCE n=1 Tax=Dillenia turbinata TaxID=194707 RepID=A0AAN8UPJ6_9MAGN
MFDTTYLTNDSAIPLAPFVGVNHHGQTILLGCGLIANEDTETFMWLFKAWLSSVSGHCPNAIITDQDKALQEAVQNVIPNPRHQWCLWHIMRRLPEKVKEYDYAEQIKVALQTVVYDSLTKDEFVDGWKNFVKEFNLQENEWLNGLYEEQHRWFPAFVKDTFWAGLSTIKKGETMNAFFDGYVNSRTTLKQFVEQYDQALKFRVEREAQSDFHSYSLRIACITHFEIEKQFQAIYTISKFKEVQLELTGTMYCDILTSNEGDGLGEGILCRHGIKVLARRKIIKVPEKYIVSRWRKDLKRQYTRFKTSYNDLSNYPDARRHDMMQQMFEEVASLAMEFDDKSGTVISCLRSQFSYVKQRVDALDLEKLIYNYTVIEGDGLVNLESVSYEVKLEPAPDGGSISKVISKYFTKGDVVPSEEEIKAGKERVLGMTKNFAASPFKYVKDRIDALDKEKYYCMYTLIEGDPLNEKLESVTYEVRFEGYGPRGCVCKVSSEYIAKENVGIKEEEIKQGKDRAIGMYEVVEAYLLAYPLAYT